ncbi:MAG TPA: serine hydrolase domain-containing protein [Allosphingosinicella sp.]|jgi:CubicO group peptidase (beta-lactamase class C family)|nr:serine hydrolase domain-containing protein [Allosphingosinicella sp.]
MAHWAGRTFVIAVLLACPVQALAEARPRLPVALAQEMAELIGRGDQSAYESFAASRYAPSVLADSFAAFQASLLARIYTDTGGFDRLRPVGAAPGWVLAEGRARITGLRYCLTVTYQDADGRSLVTGVTARDLHSAGPRLADPRPAELTGELDRVARAFERRNLFSGVILLAKDGRVVFRRAYGAASLRLGVPMRLDTRLNTASIAKMFTGVAIAQLVESGRLSYDDTLGDRWPDFPNPRIRSLTIRQLLSHTSGLGPNDYYDDPRYPSVRDSLANVADYLRLAMDTPVENSPGTYNYSNSGFIVLGALVERLSGEDFYDYVGDHIFRPAGMRDSFYAPGDVRRLRTAASLTNFREQPDHSHLFVLGPPVESPAMGGSTGGPQGGAWVTADDLFRFSQALRDGRLVSPQTLARMATAEGPPGAGPAGLLGEARAALGMEVIRNNGHVFYGHTGGDFGIASFIYWYPQTGYTTVVLSNRDPRAVRVLTNLSRALITRRSLDGAAAPSGHCLPPA